MNGADLTAQAIEDCGIGVCFANPGTTELHLLQALAQRKGIRCVLGLNEGVVTGAADGYARMSDRLPVTVMHHGPGMANGLANLHNARRARSRIVNIVGDHPAALRQSDPPLTSNIDLLADYVGSVHRARGPADLPGTVMSAVRAVLSGEGSSIGTIVLPADQQWADVKPTFAFPAKAPRTCVETENVAQAADRLKKAHRAAIYLGAGGLSRSGLIAASRLVALTGCALFSETFPARQEFGPDLPTPVRLPYVASMAREVLRGFDTIVLAGAPSPSHYFADPQLEPLLGPEVTVVSLARPSSEVTASMHALVDHLGAYDMPTGIRTGGGPLVQSRPSGKSAEIVKAIADAIPSDAIIVDEGGTAAGLFTYFAGKVRSSYLGLTGGACGHAIACGLGAALACPDRRVVSIVGDGGAAFLPQALWTCARENADIIIVVLANSGYRILEAELAIRTLAADESLADLTRLRSPEIDWRGLANAFGVDAARVSGGEEFEQCLRYAFGRSGPYLIEVAC